MEIDFGSLPSELKVRRKEGLENAIARAIRENRRGLSKSEQVEAIEAALRRLDFQARVIG